VIAQEPPPADLLDFMEEEYWEIRRNGGGPFGGPATLDRESMDYILRDHGIDDRDERRVLRRTWYEADRALKKSLEEQRPSKKEA
jgi:hypothetical protein